MIQHPHLSPGHVRQLVKAEAEPTIDPGEVLNRRAWALQQTNVARSFAEGLELAARELPEHWAAYNAGLRMPVASVREKASLHDLLKIAR